MITQIINIIQWREFTGLGDDFSEYLNSISYRDDEEFIAFVSNTVLQKYLENMKRDKVWGSEVDSPHKNTHSNNYNNIADNLSHLYVPDIFDLN